MVPADKRACVLDNLLGDIREHGCRLTTGDVGNRYLFRTLADNGLDSVMSRMHNHYEAPGYGFQLQFGATTLTEQWDPRQGPSWNHFMMGQIDEWLFPLPRRYPGRRIASRHAASCYPPVGCRRPHIGQGTHCDSSMAMSMWTGNVPAMISHSTL